MGRRTTRKAQGSSETSQTPTPADPVGTDGFEFVEYAAPDPDLLRALFDRMGLPAVARHRSKDVTLHKQGDINFIINAEPDSFAQRFARQHGPCACAMAFRVKDVGRAVDHVVRNGAILCPGDPGPMELNIPAIEGIGGSRLYLVDRYDKQTIYDIDFVFDAGWQRRVRRSDTALTHIDHLTHNVQRGNMALWASFYERLFGFREIRYFDIEGRLTGLVSQAMVSPCGKIRIPLNESQDATSQVEEFLREYRGEGIQHIALASSDIYRTVDALRAAGIELQDTPETYYDAVDARVPGHTESIEALRSRRILIDGAPLRSEGVLLQIFTRNVIGPIFFEVIQRKGNEGFGEGNFRALFESIERDQIRRGVLRDESEED
jgi:4-hydroxyphenylpyruvate dioxygenase